MKIRDISAPVAAALLIGVGTVGGVATAEPLADDGSVTSSDELPACSALQSRVVSTRSYIDERVALAIIGRPGGDGRAELTRVQEEIRSTCTERP